ncbi:MAG: hypothetical protein R3F11_08730 [Verrucomicrobiales bacterium]
MAALEEGLLDALIARVEIFCKLRLRRQSLGPAWSVPPSTTSRSMPSVQRDRRCAIDTIPSPVPEAFCDPIGELQNAIMEGSEEHLINEIVGENGGKVIKIIELVQTCTEATRSSSRKCPSRSRAVCALHSKIVKSGNRAAGAAFRPT